MKLYFAPFACSIGIRVLLEEIGRPYDAERADLSVAPPNRPLTAINPKSKVPTLVRDDGSVLTEYPAIAWWLARNNPDAALIPAGAEAEARTLEALDFCVSTLHMQGFTRLFRPSRFAPSDADADAVKAAGRDIIAKGFDRMAATLNGNEWLMGDYSAADSALFYTALWAERLDVPMPAAVAAHLERMRARPAVAAAVAKDAAALPKAAGA